MRRLALTFSANDEIIQTMKTVYFTAEVKRGRGQWHKSELYPHSFRDIDQAIFALGRQQEHDEINRIRRKYRVAEYSERRGNK